MQKTGHAYYVTTRKLNAETTSGKQTNYRVQTRDAAVYQIGYICLQWAFQYIHISNADQNISNSMFLKHIFLAYYDQIHRYIPQFRSIFSIEIPNLADLALFWKLDFKVEEVIFLSYIVHL